MDRKLVGQGCLAYLSDVRDVEVWSPSIESIHIVSEFKEVFHTDFPSMSLAKEIDFCIDLEQDTRPISILFLLHGSSRIERGDNSNLGAS